MVGSDGDNLTSHLGVVLMRNTDETNFRWVFKQLDDILTPHGIKLCLFITDNDDGCINAMQDQFPGARVLLCRWHMNKSVLAFARTICTEEFGRTHNGSCWVDSEETNNFMKVYYSTLNSKTEDEFNERMESIGKLSERMRTYLADNWFNRHRDKLVSAWTDTVLHFGLTATSKVEGAHRVIKDWLGGSRCDILSLFLRLDAFYADHVTTSTLETAITNSKIAYRSRQPIFAAIVGKVTRYALRLLAEQLKLARDHLRKEKDDATYTARCSGAFSSSFGLPCCHDIMELERQSLPLQLKNIHDHWLIDRSTRVDDVYVAPRLLEPATIITRRNRAQVNSHQRGAGVRGNRREPTLEERLDDNHPAPHPMQLPSSMRVAADPTIAPPPQASHGPEPIQIAPSQASQRGTTGGGRGARRGGGGGQQAPPPSTAPAAVHLPGINHLMAPPPVPREPQAHRPSPNYYGQYTYGGQPTMSQQPVPQSVAPRGAQQAYMAPTQHPQQPFLQPFGDLRHAQPAHQMPPPHLGPGPGHRAMPPTPTPTVPQRDLYGQQAWELPPAGTQRPQLQQVPHPGPYPGQVQHPGSYPVSYPVVPSQGSQGPQRFFVFTGPTRSWGHASQSFYEAPPP